MIPKNLLSVGEVSQKLGVSISTLRRWDNLGKLTSLRTPGNQRRYRQEQISAFLKGDKGNKGSQGDIAERTPEPFPVPSRQHPVPSRVLTFPDPHQLLYAALAAIVTVQLLHLAILKVPALKVGVDFAATTTLEGISSILGARTQEKQDVNGTTQEKIPVLSSDNPVPSRVLLSTFTHAFLKSALYSGTHYYQSFAQKTNTVSTQGTYLLASTAVAAAKNLQADMSSPTLLARSNLFPEIASPKTTLPLSEAEGLAQENLSPPPPTVLGAQVENPDPASAGRRTQDFTYGSILVDPHQSQISVTFKTPEPLLKAPTSIITTPSYLTQTALSQVTPQGFTVTLSESSPQPQTLYWLALW